MESGPAGGRKIKNKKGSFPGRANLNKVVPILPERTYLFFSSSSLLSCQVNYTIPPNNVNSPAGLSQKRGLNPGKG
jgi:hypothetical protein